MAAVWIKLIVFVVLHSQAESTRCLKRDYEIQSRLISSDRPPYDNFYNISKAVYPSVDLPSLLIKITVKFLPTEDSMDTASVNNSKQAASHRSLTANGTKTCTYTWSMSCLYVSAGQISLLSMNIFSLWAIYPNRRETELHLTLPQFCKGPPEVAPQHDTMIYFLSTLEDIAVLPHLPDSRLNTVECVIAGHGKAPGFPGLKQLLHGVCWCFLVISLVISTIVSQWVMIRLKNWDKDHKKKKEGNLKINNLKEDYPQSKIVGVMCLCLAAFVVELILVIYACCTLSTVDKENAYVPVFSAFVLLVWLRRVVWCHRVHKIKCVGCNCDLLTVGHWKNTSKNCCSNFMLYPAIFMACHHLLWLLLGIITEPFWGITVLVAVISVSAGFFFLVYEFHKAFPSHGKDAEKDESEFMETMVPSAKKEKEKEKDYVEFIMAVLLMPAGFLACVLLLIVLLVVAQAVLSQKLIATIVQNGLVLVATALFGYVKYHDGGGTGEETGTEKGEGAGGGAGGGEGAGGGVAEGEDKGAEGEESIKLVKVV